MYCKKAGEGRAGRMHLQLLETSVGTTGGGKKKKRERKMCWFALQNLISKFL